MNRTYPITELDRLIAGLPPDLAAETYRKATERIDADALALYADIGAHLHELPVPFPEDEK